MDTVVDKSKSSGGDKVDAIRKITGRVNKLFLKQLGSVDNIFYRRICNDCKSIYIECYKPINYHAIFNFGVYGIANTTTDGSETYNYTIHFHSIEDMVAILGLDCSLADLNEE